MSRPIKSSLWKSLQAEWGDARHPWMWKVLLPAVLLGGAGLLVSLRPSATPVGDYLVCSRENISTNPLLYPPDTRLVRVSGGEARFLKGFALTSRPQLSYAADRILFSARRSGDKYSQIWEMTVDASTPRRVIAVDADCVTPGLLPDGTIVFSRLERVPEGDRLIGTLYALRAGGSLSRISFGSDLDLVQKILSDGRILVHRRSPLYPDGIDLALRPDGTELERFLADTSMGSVEASAVGGGRIQPAGPDGSERAPAPSWLEPGYHVIDSIHVAPRPLPPVSTSVVKPQMDYGWLLCLDARLTDLNADLGRAHSVRVVDSKSGKALGVEPIARDGSFYLKVPADRLLRLELLDDQGRTVVRQRDGIWVRPNEHRGCEGCHESRYLSPENRSPLALEQGPESVIEQASAAPVEGRP